MKAWQVSLAVEMTKLSSSSSSLTLTELGKLVEESQGLTETARERRANLVLPTVLLLLSMLPFEEKGIPPLLHVKSRLKHVAKVIVVVVSSPRREWRWRLTETRLRSLQRVRERYQLSVYESQKNERF